MELQFTSLELSTAQSIFQQGFTGMVAKVKDPGPPKWVEQLLAGKQTDKIVVNTADENASSDKQTETSVPQTDIKHRLRSSSSRRGMM